MSASTYHILIKKEYAAAIIEDLQKMDAVELLSGEELPIPEWQKKEVRRRIKDLQKNPLKALSWDAASKKVKAMTK